MGIFLPHKKAHLCNNKQNPGKRELKFNFSYFVVGLGQKKCLRPGGIFYFLPHFKTSVNSKEILNTLNPVIFSIKNGTKIVHCIFIYNFTSY